MGFGGALFALSATQAINQVGAGYAQNAEAKYNASVLDSQAMLTGVEQDIEYGQYQRLKGKTMGKSMAAVAGMGVMPTGSPMAAMIDAQTQIGIDQAIGQFNYEREKSYLNEQAGAERRRGKAAIRSGWSNAFSTVLQGAGTYSLYKNGRTMDINNKKKSLVPSIYEQSFANQVALGGRYIGNAGSIPRY